MITIGRLTVPCIACGHPAVVTCERPPLIPRAGALTIRTTACDYCGLTIETT